MRCALSAIEVAIIQPLIDVMGKGWLFTLLGILTGAGGFAAHHTLRQRGMEWRNSRKGEGQTGIGESHAEEGRHDNESPIGYTLVEKKDNAEPEAVREDVSGTRRTSHDVHRSRIF